MLQYWPQIIYLALTVAGLILALIKHGEPRTDKHNVWISLGTTAIVLLVLYAGGFFPLNQ